MIRQNIELSCSVFRATVFGDRKSRHKFSPPVDVVVNKKPLDFLRGLGILPQFAITFRSSNHASLTKAARTPFFGSLFNKAPAVSRKNRAYFPSTVQHLRVIRGQIAKPLRFCQSFFAPYQYAAVNPVDPSDPAEILSRPILRGGVFCQSARISIGEFDGV